MVTDECEALYELKNTIEMFVWLTFIRDYWKNNRRLDPGSGHSLMYSPCPNVEDNCLQWN